MTAPGYLLLSLTRTHTTHSILKNNLTMRTKEQWAELLNGREYRSEITKQEEAEAKAEGIVIVYGASDDLVEFAGAINDEMSEGHELAFNKEGKFMPQIDDETQNFLEENDLMSVLAARHTNRLTGNYDGVWRFTTEIPHATFNVMEDGEIATVGIVFNLSDLK